MKRILLICCLALLGHLPAFAASDYVIKIDGMTCKFCAYNIKKRLSKLEGVEKVVVEQDKGMATLQVKPGTKLTDEQLKAEIAEAGYNYRGMLSKPE